MAIFSAKSWFRNQIKPYLTIVKANQAAPAPFGMSSVEIDLGIVAKVSGEFSITGLSGLTVGASVMVLQASGPYTGKGTLADECADMCNAIGVVENATTIKVFWTAIKSPLMGNVKFNYKII